MRRLGISSTVGAPLGKPLDSPLDSLGSPITEEFTWAVPHVVIVMAAFLLGQPLGDLEEPGEVQFQIRGPDMS